MDVDVNVSANVNVNMNVNMDVNMNVGVDVDVIVIVKMNVNVNVGVGVGVGVIDNVCECVGPQVKATKAEEDVMRKVAEDEGDALFAKAEAALASGDIEAAKANERAATAAYEARKIARTTTLRKLRAQISDAVKKQAADLKEKDRLEAINKAEEEVRQKAEVARLAQVKGIEETAARVAAIQAKSGAKVPLFLASQMATQSSEPSLAPSGPPKMAPELRAAAQMTGSDLNAAKKLQLEEAKKVAQVEAKEAAQQAKLTTDGLVKAGDDLMQQAQSSLTALDFTQARALRDKATTIYKQAGVNRSSSLKNFDGEVNKSEKNNAVQAAAAEKKRVADAKAAVEAAVDAEAEVVRKREVRRQVEMIRAAADKQAELSAKGGVKVPLFMASQMAKSDSTPALKAPPRGGAAAAASVLEAPPAATPTTQTPVVQTAVAVSTASSTYVVTLPPPLRPTQSPGVVAETSTPAAPAPAAAPAAAAFEDDTPLIDWGARLDAIRKASTDRLV